MNNRSTDLQNIWQMIGLTPFLALLTAFLVFPAVVAQPGGDPGYNPKEAPGLFPKDGRRPGAPSGDQPGNGKTEAGAWTIVLVAFRGPDADQMAQLGLDKVRKVAGLTDAYVDKRVRSTIVAVGRYADPDSKQAHEDLKRIREMIVERTRPFASAFMAPPERSGPLGKRPEYDLVNARQQFGAKAAKYTLQIGAYGPADPTKTATPEERADARKAAEQAAEQLRRDGEMAFYYHGPNLSMVTIGVFGDEVLDKFEPPDLAALKQRFPHNLYNGAGVRDTRNLTGKGVMVASKLVRIPENEGSAPAPAGPPSRPR